MVLGRPALITASPNRRSLQTWRATCDLMREGTTFIALLRLPTVLNELLKMDFIMIDGN